jgi:hypothetical protein
MRPPEDTQVIVMIIATMIVTEEMNETNRIVVTYAEPSTGAENTAGSERVTDTGKKDPIAVVEATKEMIIEEIEIEIEIVAMSAKNAPVVLPKLVRRPLLHQQHQKLKPQGLHLP